MRARSTWLRPTAAGPRRPPPRAASQPVPRPGNGVSGCPIPATEHVRVYVDGELAASQDVDTAGGEKLDTYALDVTVPAGTHEITVEWEDDGTVIASADRTVVHVAPGVDRDADSVSDDSDNCVRHPNTDQDDTDGDGAGDATAAPRNIEARA